MKRNLLITMVAIAGIFFGCSDSDYRTETVEYMIYEPVFMSAKEFRSQEIKTKSAQQINEQGKI